MQISMPSLYIYQKTLNHMFILAAILIFVITFPPCDANDPTITIPNVGTLSYTSTSSSWSSNNIFEFRGVRFAESPTGNRRFKAPVPISERSDIQIYENRQCPTISTIANMTLEEMTAAEDCLHMSIYTKSLSAKQPVMVYIHGGSFYEGAAYHHPPNYILEKNVVLVVPQYRLGPLGFLSTNTKDIPGNVAVLDIILALQWVQAHISYFGGSNTSVTLFGQSAGAALISSLLYSPHTPPDLFHRLILQSGSAINNWAFDGNFEENAREIAQYAGCPTLGTMQNLNSCFMTMDVKTMLTAFFDHTLWKLTENIALYGGSKLTYGPLNNLFTLPPNELLENVAYQNISILGGVTKHDGSFLFATFFDLLTPSEITDNKYISNHLVERLNRFLGVPEYSGTVNTIQRDLFFSREIIESGDFMRMIDGLIDITSVAMFKAPILRLFQNRNTAKDLFLYSFDYEGEFTRFGYGDDTSHYPFNGGIHHSNDNLYIFPYPSFASNLNERDTIMAKTMVDFWTSFATTGTPTSAYCSKWPPFTTRFGPYLHINQKCTVGVDYVDEFNVGSREAAATNNSFSSCGSNVLLFLVIIKLKLNQWLLQRYTN